MSEDALWLVIAVIAGALALAAFIWRERFILRTRRRAATGRAGRGGRPSGTRRAA